MKSVFQLWQLLLLIGIAMGIKDPICGLAPFFEGNGAVCMASMPTISYNPATNKCVEWVYGGCGGNDNQFDTKEECEAKCMV